MAGGPKVDASRGVTMDSRLDTVAATLARELGKAYGWRTVGDLLTHYPRTYVRKGDVSDLDRLLVPAQSGLLEAVRVSTLVNNPRNEDPRCIEAEA